MREAKVGGAAISKMEGKLKRPGMQKTASICRVTSSFDPAKGFGLSPETPALMAPVRVRVSSFHLTPQKDGSMARHRSGSPPNKRRTRVVFTLAVRRKVVKIIPELARRSATIIQDTRN
ncbi:hypothetical protein Nepgr_027353 [Nepenthes gracilis]|uniref:Uncharacterized protein n=1 Tax=Nepenthes gracilis TaxID=150966 RepID=A0AAD3T9Q8_NEPGR|nr:hypothetical protein Nepgr_027353 [Nepenthes gracilis]